MRINHKRWVQPSTRRFIDEKHFGAVRTSNLFPTVWTWRSDSTTWSGARLQHLLIGIFGIKILMECWGFARNMDWSFVEAESSDGKCVLELVDSEETKKARVDLKSLAMQNAPLLLVGVAIWVSLHLHCGVERWWVGHFHESCNLASIGWRDGAGARVTPCYGIKPLLSAAPYKDNLSESECTFTTGIHSNLPEDFWFFGCVLCLASPVSKTIWILKWRVWVRVFISHWYSRTSNAVIVTLNNVQATMTSLTLTSLELRESLRVVPMRKLFRIHFAASRVFCGSMSKYVSAC